MKTMTRLAAGAVLGCYLGLIVGCPTSQSPEETVNNVENSHDHEHDHAHDHEAEGPHEGHLIELGDEEYHAEWLHDDELSKVTIYLLDSEAKADVPIAAQHITITTVVTGNEPKDYNLLATNPTEDDPPTAFCFEIVDQELLTALKISEGVQSTLSVDINGKQYQARIEHHDHDHHH